MAAALATTVVDRTKPKAVDAPRPAHHTNDSQTSFVNPWPSFAREVAAGFNLKTVFGLWQDWETKPMPPKEELPKVSRPKWADGDAKNTASRDLQTTWLGHACHLTEFPTRADSASTRGFRVLFDPVWSHRCSPSQFLGPARFTEPPIKLEEIPEVDVVVLSHNHYDHTDVTTLKHIYHAHPQTLFFAPLGNAKWFHSLGFAKERVFEMDWWDEKEIKAPNQAPIRLVCTPCQHFTGRSLTDRNKTLWSSWAVLQSPQDGSPAASVWFGGDTGYRSVPRGTKDESNLPTCPAFKEIGERLGPFSLGLIPIGAYSPRGFMSHVHCSPEDSVQVHLEVNAKRSLGIHWGAWRLTDEPVNEPPERLRSACKAAGIAEGVFDVTYIGGTVVIEV